MTTASQHKVLVSLRNARRVAAYALQCGYEVEIDQTHEYPEHLGAVMADSILQAGVNYRSVVHPRVVDILTNYPEANELKGVENIIASGLLPHFLKWQHSVKIDRFHSLAVFLGEHSVNTTSDLRMNLQKTEFRAKLLCVFGVGRKTIDYMACLVGLDHIAVDRHIKAFAKSCEVHSNDYDILQRSFGFAADLMGAGRRHFDAWVWSYESQNKEPRHTSSNVQLNFAASERRRKAK
ncbi:MAG: hypothetical protein AAF583_12170 [Pseudomonadota bacterium]